MRHSASVMPLRATDSSTWLVTRITSANRSGWQAAYTDRVPLSAKMSTAE